MFRAPCTGMESARDQAVTTLSIMRLNASEVICQDSGYFTLPPSGSQIPPSGSGSAPTPINFPMNFPAKKKTWAPRQPGHQDMGQPPAASCDAPRWWMLPSLTVLLLSLLAYSSTASAFVQGGDSGELMAMACAGGVPHPPGYPLITMVGRVWLYATGPMSGSPAYRLSLLSAIFGAVAAGVLALAGGVASGGGWMEGAVGAGMWALSDTTWKYSQHYEVFSLNNLLCASLLLLALQYHARHPEKDHNLIPEAGALLIGLGVCNQHTSVLLSAPLAISILSCGFISPLRFASLALIGLFSLSPYLYLPLSSSPPIGSWGEHKTIEGFSRHFFRREYGTLQLYTSGSPEQDEREAPPFPSRFSNVCGSMAAACPLASLFAAPAGAAYLLARPGGKRGARVGACLIVSFLVYVGVFGALANLPEGDFFAPILERFWMQPLLLVSVLTAVGLRFFGTLCGAPHWASIAAVAMQIGAWGMWGTGANQAAATLGLRKTGQKDIVEKFARDVLVGLPEGAIVLSTGDVNYYPLLYLQHCEGLRRDVLPINTAMVKGVWFTPVQSQNYGNVTFPGSVYVPRGGCPPSDRGVGYGVECWLTHNLKKGGRRVFLAKSWPPGEDEEGVGWEVRPWGLVKEVLVPEGGRGGRAVVKKWGKWLTKAVRALPPLGSYVEYYRRGHGDDGWGEGLNSWEKVVVHDYLSAHTAMSKYLISALRDNSARLGIPSNHSGTAERALTISRGVKEAMPGDALPAKNLGALLQHLMNTAGEEDARRRFMSEMCTAYNQFVVISMERGDGDPDGPILRDWVRDVERWMSANPFP